MKYEYTYITKNRSLEQAKLIHEQRIRDSIQLYDKYKDKFIERACPICGGKEYQLLEKFLSKYNVVSCTKCRSVYVNPVPNLDALSDYYNNCKSNKMLNSVYTKRSKGESFIIDDRVEEIITMINEMRKKYGDQKQLTILEIGCNSGAFLLRLRSKIEQRDIKNVNFVGVDVDSDAIKEALKVSSVFSNIDFIDTTAEQFAEKFANQFDVVICYELIEHLIDPFSFVCSVRDLICDGGYLIISTNNYAGLEITATSIETYRPIAHNIFPPMHLNAFSTQNITHFAIRCGFNVERITTPGKLDMDILSNSEGEFKHDVFKKITEFDVDIKAIIQELVVQINSSGHMRCALRK